MLISSLLSFPWSDDADRRRVDTVVPSDPSSIIAASYRR